MIGKVKIEIDFGGRAETKLMVGECYDGSTVFSMLKEMNAIRVESRGSGKNTFLIAIDDVENEGANGDNWIYRLNGEVGKVGAGEQKVVPGDEINWTFGDYEVPEN